MEWFNFCAAWSLTWYAFYGCSSLSDNTISRATGTPAITNNFFDETNELIAADWITGKLANVFTILLEAVVAILPIEDIAVTNAGDVATTVVFAKIREPLANWTPAKETAEVVPNIAPTPKVTPIPEIVAPVILAASNASLISTTPSRLRSRMFLDGFSKFSVFCAAARKSL